MKEEGQTKELLREWRIESQLPNDFNSGVWRRIEKEQASGESIFRWLTQLFAKPALAVSYVSVALVVGLLAGRAHASRDVQQAELQAKSKYIQTVDPYAKGLIE